MDTFPSDGGHPSPLFNDGRSRKVILVAHCILNQNASSDGTAGSPGAVQALVDVVLRSGTGILQLPCPELACLGLDRGDPAGGRRPVVQENTRIRAALELDASRQRLNVLAEEVACQIDAYVRHGFSILGLVGIDRSPSCGVNTTSRQDAEVPGEGVFVEILKGLLDRRGNEILMIGAKVQELDASLTRLRALLPAPGRSAGARIFKGLRRVGGQGASPRT